MEQQNMERLFYSPTQYAKEVIESNPSTKQINHFINFNSLRESKDFDNYNVKPITIKIIGSTDNNINKNIRLNIAKQLYARMKLYNESREDDCYLCIRTDCTKEKTYSAIDGDHSFYSSKVLLIPSNTKLYNELEELEQQQNEQYRD